MTQEDTGQIRDIYLKLKGGVFNFKGSSMEPVLKEGDVLRVIPADKTDIRAGDIVIFNANVLGCHRILGRFRRDNRLCFLEKGDNANKIGRIFYEDIIGKVKYIVTENGLKKPDFPMNWKNVMFFILDFFIAAYMVLADLLKNRLFLKGDNKFLKTFGIVIWRVHGFYFNALFKNIT